MKGSELISAVQTIIDKHGDIQVAIDDCVTGWPLYPIIEYGEVDTYGPFIAIRSEYHNDENKLLLPQHK